MQNIKKTVGAIVFLFVLIEFSLIFGTYDLDIWIKFGNAQSQFGLTMEVLGELVAPLLFSLSGIVLMFYYNSQPDFEAGKKPKTITAIVFAAIGVLYCVFVLLKSELPLVVKIGFIIFSIAILLAGTFLVLRCDAGQLFQLYCIAITTVVYCISVLVIISVIKFFWGRVRPRDMTDFAQYTPFFLPQGITGNRSFPSGHTSNATILFVITMFVPMVKKNWQKVVLYAVPIVWIVIMAYGRVICGAHFASDVLYGAAISICLFYASKAIVIRRIAASLK